MTDTESLLNKNKRDGLTRTLVVSIFIACLGMLQFGYHIAELNAPQKVMTCTSEGHISDCIDLTDQQFATITSVFCIGGLLGSLMAGKLTDLWGRRKMCIIANIINIIGSIFMVLAHSFGPMFIGRFVVGVGCGIILVITPIFINEISPIYWRGSLGTMNQFSINVGILLTQLMGLYFASVVHWRLILLLTIFIAFINFICWLTIFESPKWLLSQSNFNSAYIALAYLRDKTTDEIKDEITKWQSQTSSNSNNILDSDSGIDGNNNNNRSNFGQNDEKSSPTMLNYIFDPQFRKPRNVITMILMGQQFVGINSIMFYGVKIISDTTTEDTALLINFVISIINVIMTFVSSQLIIRYGRKSLLMTSCTMMGIMSLLISYSIVNMESTLLTLSIFIYIASFAIGIGPIPFLFISEISRAEERSTAQSYGTVCNWLGTFIIGYTFPLLQNLVGGYVYLLFAIFAFVFTGYIKKRVPETYMKDNYNEIWSNF